MPFYLQLLRSALGTELAAISPIILVLLAVGLATAIVQAALQIEDTAFSLLPKLIAMIVIGLFGGFGLLHGFEQFAVLWIRHAPDMVQQPWR
jgi:flagellar biosynthetic protein FliQ